MACSGEYWELILKIKNKKIETSVTCFDFAKQNNIDATVPKARSHKKVVATASRHECVYKRTGESSEPFYEKGVATEHIKNDHL